jgi:hypothetical protein
MANKNKKFLQKLRGPQELLRKGGTIAGIYKKKKSYALPVPVGDNEGITLEGSRSFFKMETKSDMFSHFLCRPASCREKLVCA